MASLPDGFFWFGAHKIKMTKKPTRKPVYGSVIRKLYDWPKYYEVTFHFETTNEPQKPREK